MGDNMMNFEEFTQSMLKRVSKKAKGTFDAMIKSVAKNNGVRLTGIMAEAEGCSCAPCVYLDDYYRMYANKEMKLSEAADEVYSLLKKHLEAAKDISISGFTNWVNIRENVRAKLINAEQNKEQLAKIPHRMFLDLAVVYYVTVSGCGDEKLGTILICNEHMEMWGQEEENLYRTAMLNMRSDGRPDFNGIKDVIKSISQDADCFLNDGGRQLCTGMYVLTNCSRRFGASEILDKSTLRAIADKIGDGFIVLPSSVHELIILEPDDAAEYEELADMVKEVNTTQVDVGERLSDHVYVYSRSEEVLKVVA